ncbi:DNA (cytosine-5-)-methyltransferase [Mucisphaera sp.]|uniref:DNA (cytosine-5-)-methyltransferase n=1 Tax=Mucisphaera sp. TaxID=2913024 RepID=UPI003D103A4D
MGQSDISDINNSQRSSMPQLLLRDIPEDLKDWIDNRSHGLRTSQKEFVLSVLLDAWKSGNTKLPLFDGVVDKRVIDPPSIPFTFIDLFAGVGGMRIGLERNGGRCLFTSEWDKYAQKTYHAWHGDMPEGDIRTIDPEAIPDHDVLAAGFPCQPFSIAGVSKKNSLGREHGFKDVTQGTLFFHVAEIIEAKRPPVVLLENVKNLRSHDKGKTWGVIRQTLENLGYVVHDRIIDAAPWVPQHRERIFIVCFDTTVFGSSPGFKFPEPPANKSPRFRDILDPDTPAKYTLTDHLWSYLQAYAAKHKAAGNGFGFGMTDLDGVSRTLSARYYKDGSEVLIPQKKGQNPRRLSPREAARLMGFPDDLPIVVSDTQAYKQFGNAVVPLVVEAIGRQIIKVIGEHLTRRPNGCLIKTTSRGRRSA